MLLIDEIHRLPARVAESLYAVMDEPGRLTVIGATTDEDRLPPTMLSRFAIRGELEYYGLDDLVEILRRQASRLGVDLDDAAASAIAAASRQTPRLAIALLRSARDEAQLRGRDRIDAATVRSVLDSLGVDTLGLTRLDRRYIAALRRADRPLGLSTLADRLGKTQGVVRKVIEPWLIRCGLVARTPLGRVLTASKDRRAAASAP